MNAEKNKQKSRQMNGVEVLFGGGALCDLCAHSGGPLQLPFLIEYKVGFFFLDHLFSRIINQNGPENDLMQESVPMMQLSFLPLSLFVVLGLKSRAFPDLQ